MEIKTERDHRIIAGITHGDFNGIGYEVILKTFSDIRIMDSFIPVVYGSSKIMSYYRKNFGFSELNINVVKSPEQALPKRINVINIYEEEVKVEAGKSTQLAGELSFLAIEKAVQDILEMKTDVLITGPINKANIQSTNFSFPGHTEYLAMKANAQQHLMLLLDDHFRIGVATGHIPLRNVPQAITIDLILKKIEIFSASLKRDFGVNRPKIAVLGLNPHAGDGGLLGAEENDVIIPAIQKATDNNYLVLGPFPSDGFFGSEQFLKFDGILAMYHDQGLTPFKALSFKNGINFTAGLSFVRTSPDHGTAYSIAGKNLASPDSFRAALFSAGDIFRKRNEYDELKKNPLPFSTEGDSDTDDDLSGPDIQ